MAKHKPSPDPTHTLRARAEIFLAKSSPELEQIPLSEVQQLVHELDRHQEELNVQNEDLRRALENLEEIRAKYAALYDFAPVGYFTLDPKGLILEANLTGASLLGKEPSSLIFTPFFFACRSGIPNPLPYAS